MTDEQILNRNKLIGENGLKTRIKRKSQVCHTYECKIQDNRLSSKQREQLKMMFVEAKWLYNDILAWSNIEGNRPWDYKMGKTVSHYDKDGNLVESEYKYLATQIKQEVQRKICSSIKGLTTLKKQGYNVGKLKFISEVRSIHVKQVYSLKFMGGKYIKLPKVDGNVKISGLDQFIHIPGIEVACYDILNTPSGYYIKFCTYQPKLDTKKEYRNKTIGIDLGCSNTITTSEGKKYNVKVRETDKLNHLQRQLSKKKGYKKGEQKSNNFKRLTAKIRKEYQHISNIKKDKANKIVHDLVQNKFVVMQDENISSWHKKDKNRTSKSVQHSILGRVKSKLLSQPNVVVISRWCPTTKLCSCCGNIIDMPLNKRTFVCEQCGITQDRDIHAANNMVWFYNNKIGVGRTELTRVEMRQEIASAIVRQTSKVLSVKHEDI